MPTSKKDYVAIAKAIDLYGQVIDKDDLINHLCKVFTKDNPRFDCNKFTKACKKTDWDKGH